MLSSFTQVYKLKVSLLTKYLLMQLVEMNVLRRIQNMVQSASLSDLTLRVHSKHANMIGTVEDLGISATEVGEMLRSGTASQLRVRLGDLGADSLSFIRPKRLLTLSSTSITGIFK